ncbi:MAG: FHA domain-containing protein [Chloroflexota bacterium]
MGIRSMSAWQRSLFLTTVIGVFMGVLFAFKPVTAQQTPPGKVEIVAINSERFPRIQIVFEAYGADGEFISGLNPANVYVVEDNNLDAQPRLVESLEMFQPGLEVILAVNFGPDLNTRFAGSRRFENIQQRLREWVAATADSNDHLSLATNNGLVLIRSGDRQEWLDALDNLSQVKMLEERPDLTSISRALDLAVDISGDTENHRAILFITPLLPPANLEAIANLTERTARLDAPVYIWLAASPQGIAANTPVFNALGNLAGATGGELSIYSGAEALPDVEGYLRAHRNQYRLEYTSALNTSATHVLALRIAHAGGTLESENRPVYLNILPPNPIFLSPQTRIERKFPSNDADDANLEPDLAAYRIIIEFPDGYPRAVRAARLYVNGEIVHENTAAPFDAFDWNIAAVTQDSQHILQVEVEDTLGLVQRSIEMPVTISVETRAPNAWQAALSGNRPLVLAAVLISALLLLGIMMMVLRRSPRRWLRRGAGVESFALPRERSRPLKRIPYLERPTWPHSAIASISSAPAWLVQCSEEQPAVAPPAAARLESRVFPLKYRENLLGSDPLRVQHLVESASVSPVHARIVQEAGGEYHLYDCSSVAGTWVNFVLIPIAGVGLRHGDTIHLGNVSLRFELAHPPQERPAVVQPYQEAP